MMYKKRLLLHTALSKSFVKYGVENHSFEIIESCLVEILNEREVFWIRKLNSYHRVGGLNLSMGGDGGLFGYKHSEESKKNMAKAQFGKKHSEETKKKMSESAKGKVKSEAHLKNLSKSLKGKKLSEERRRQISIANTGRKVSEETRKKLSLIHIGKPHSIEWIENLKKNHVGRTGKKNTHEHMRAIIDSNIKIVLNKETGIFYIGVKDAADSIDVPRSTLTRKLCGITPNNTSFTYV